MTTSEATAEDQALALKRAALELAVEYHARAAQHPESRGSAKPSTVTASAREFAAFLAEVADRASVTEQDIKRTNR